MQEKKSRGIKSNSKGNLILLFTAFIWGMAFAFQSEAGDVLGPFTFGAARMTCAALAVGVLCFILDSKEKKCKAQINKEYAKATMLGGIICGVFMGIATTFQQIGLMYTSAGKSGFITALYILIVPVISALIFKRKITGRVWIAVAIAVVGMYFLCITPGEGLSFNKGDIFTVICAIFFSLQILFADIYVPHGNAVKIAEIEFIVIAIVSWILAFIFETPQFSALEQALVPILYCGFISGGAGYTLQLVGQKYTDPTPASLCMSFESVFAVVGGVIILSERMSGRELIGCIVMFAAIILVQLPENLTGDRPPLEI